MIPQITKFIKNMDHFAYHFQLSETLLWLAQPACVKIRSDQKGSKNGGSAKPKDAKSSGLDLRP